MIDKNGFRANVGIILLKETGKVFWARRQGMSAWQFPQGGIQERESPEQAMYRELEEEVGLTETDVELLGKTSGWMRYRLPRRYIRYNQTPVCIGQKQRWFVLHLLSDEASVNLENGAEPEFDEWRWINYWEALDGVVDFKRKVYKRALSELAPLAADLTQGLVALGPDGSV